MPLGDVKLMGVCNVTPDSFSGDGWMSSGQNQYQQLQRGNELQKELLNVVEQGADVVDVGGESTAPGSTKVDPADEMERLRVVMESVKSLLAARPGTATFSVDTVNAGTARAAIGCGFTMINDVSGGRNDDGMFPLVAAHPEVKYVMMYCKNASGRADLDDDQTNAQASILSFFDEQVARALREGVQRSQLILDPGMGAFISVRAEDSIEAMRAVPEFKARYKCPVCPAAHPFPHPPHYFPLTYRF